VENYKPQIEIDPSWEMVELGEVCEFKRGPFGGALKKEIFVPQGNLVYEQYHAINNDFSFARYFIDDKKFSEMRAFQVKAGDMIVSCSGTMGRVAIIPEKFKKGIINQALLRLRITKKQTTKEFLKLYLESRPIQERFFLNQVGSAIQNVASVKYLKTIPFPKLSISEQIQIAQKIEQEQEAIDRCKWLIETYTKKIQDKIDKVWGTTSSQSYPIV